MAITKQTPKTIHLGGPVVAVNDLVAGGAITPGYLIERYSASGTPKFQAHSTASGMAAKTVALEPTMLNKTVDDAYAAGDLVEAAVLAPGAAAWMLIASGQTLVAGDFMESTGNGTIRKYTSGVRLFQALEDKTAAFTGLTRIRVEAL